MYTCCNEGCENPVAHPYDECRECFDSYDEPTVAQSWEQAGTWSWMCPHGRPFDDCWDCNQTQ